MKLTPPDQQPNGHTLTRRDMEYATGGAPDFRCRTKDNGKEFYEWYKYSESGEHGSWMPLGLRTRVEIHDR